MRAYLLGLASGILLITVAGAGYSRGYHSGVAAADSVFAVSYQGSSLLRVNTDGKVGIGTDDPQARLHVKSGSLLVDGGIQSTSGGFTYPDAATRAVAPAVRFLSLTVNSSNIGTLSCAAGEVVVGGGFSGPPGIAATADFPLSTTQWQVVLNSAPGAWAVYAICAKGVT